MSISKRLFAGAVALSLLGGGASAAVAASSPSLCSSDRVCLFADANWDKLMGSRAGGGGLVNISAANNDDLSSWSNKTGYHGGWYTNSNGGGWCYTMHPRTNNSYVGIAFNDIASSWRTNRAC